MKKYLLLLYTTVLFVSCNNSNKSNDDAFEQGMNDAKATKEKMEEKQTPPKEERKLRFLNYSNGGLTGYYNDGSVTGCPRCDLLQSNVDAMYTDKPFDTYTIGKDGHLKMKDGEERIPDAKDNNLAEGWAMIDYKWTVDMKTFNK